MKDKYYFFAIALMYYLRKKSSTLNIATIETPTLVELSNGITLSNEYDFEKVKEEYLAAFNLSTGSDIMTVDTFGLRPLEKLIDDSRIDLASSVAKEAKDSVAISLIARYRALEAEYKELKGQLVNLLMEENYRMIYDDYIADADKFGELLLRLEGGNN